MSNKNTFTVKTTVSKNKTSYGTNEYSIVVEGSGFTGEGSGIFLGQVFEKAYEDLMVKVSEAIFKDE